ncbi:MAG: magnesium chelatase [Balneolaceae bacterium]
MGNELMIQENVTKLGELKNSGWKSISVKDEIRKNMIRKMKEDEPLFPDIVGYDQTVIPQLQHAILAKHDLILLGLRGQAKTRILRLLVQFLDEYMPVVKGSEINDDPFRPVSRFAREKVLEMGDETPIEWVHRDQRYGEKLATPDTTVADLIGDIDPIKAAARRLTLADEQVINFGLVPRTNRGIFVINELPDLQPRIQVALLNIMQERDIQIRGFNIRIPLDVAMAYSANPEDYTNRGNIITPLKDRIDAQIITHYPRDLSTGMKITEQEAKLSKNGEVKVHLSPVYREIIEEVAFTARESEYVDQKSGVSTRMTITSMELAYSAAERRALLNDEDETTIRIADIFHMVPAITGKMELVYEGEQEGAINVARHITGKAINNVFKRHFPDPQEKKGKEENPYDPILNWFSSGNEIEIPDRCSDKVYRKKLKKVKGLSSFVKNHSDHDKQYQYVIMDLVLEGLHQNSVLGKEDLDEERSFRDMLGSMLGDMDDFDDDDFEERF